MWYEKHENIVRLARWLVMECAYDAGDLLYFLEKPWKWEKEWKEIQ